MAADDELRRLWAEIQPILRYYSGISLDRSRKTLKTLEQSLGSELNPKAPKYKPDVAYTQPKLYLEDLKMKFHAHVLHWSLCYTSPQGISLIKLLPKNKHGHIN
jgi:hypothetical protein